MVHQMLAILADEAIDSTGSNSALAESLGGLGDLLIPSWVSFVVQCGALAVLIAIVMLCAYRPVKKMVQKRQDYIESNIRAAEESKAAALLREQQSAEIILESKKQAALIVEEAQKAAKQDKEVILAETQNEVAKMKSDAEIDIERSKQEALEEIHKEMVDVALAASSEILKREVSKDDNARLAEEFIKDLN